MIEWFNTSTSSTARVLAPFSDCQLSLVAACQGPVNEVNILAARLREAVVANALDATSFIREALRAMHSRRNCATNSGRLMPKEKHAEQDRPLKFTNELLWGYGTVEVMSD
jgi:hypothetical protein